MATESPQWQSASRHVPPPTAARIDKRQQLSLSRPRWRPRGATLDTESATRALGWLSIALGAGATLAPRPLASLTGLSDRSSLLPLVGLRELASGVGLLTQQDRTLWLWSRVIGDAMDLAVISSALRSSNPRRTRALGTAGVVAAIAAVDLAVAISSTRERRAVAAGPFSEGLIVNRTPQECYDFWCEPANLPRFIAALESVAQIDDHHARWMLRGSHSPRLALTVRTTRDQAAKRIAWHSVGRSDIAHAGVVHFEAVPGNRGTRVTASLVYPPSSRGTGIRTANLAGAVPRSRLREDLRRFKQLIEAGEIATTRGQPFGRRSFLGRWISEVRRSRRTDLT